MNVLTNNKVTQIIQRELVIIENHLYTTYTWRKYEIYNITNDFCDQILLIYDIDRSENTRIMIKKTAYKKRNDYMLIKPNIIGHEACCNALARK